MAGLLDAAGGLTKAIPFVGMGLSAAGQIFGAIKGAKEKKKNQELLDKNQAENKASYDLKANQSFLDTNVAKAEVTQAKDDLVDERKNVAGRAAVTGGSDESVVANNSRVSKNYNNRLANLSGMATGYQQNQEANYRNTKANLDNQQMSLNQQSADSAANLVENASGLASTAALGIGGVKTAKTVAPITAPGTLRNGNLEPMKQRLPGATLNIPKQP